MKTNVTNTSKVQANLDAAQASFRAGRLNASDIAKAAIFAEADLAEAGIPKSKRSGALYRVYTREGSGTYAVLTRGPSAYPAWYLTEVGRVTGVHGPSRVYTGIDRDELALYDTLGITPEDFVRSFDVGQATVRASGVDVGVRRGIGGSAWVAEVTGVEESGRLERAFVSRHRSDLSRSGKTGGILWEAMDDGIYEAGGFCTAAGDGVHTMHVFFIVRDGQVASLGNRTAAVTKAVTA